MKLNRIKYKKTVIAFILYWFLITINVTVSMKYGLTSIVEWWMNTFVFLLFMLTFMLKPNSKLSLPFKILFMPASWLIHAILTIPSSLVLGVLKYDPEHIRTMGEHRAIFILASLPIIFYGMSKSKLFSNELSTI